MAERISVGYDCEFVDPPPKLLQSECAICLLVLREPHLTSCCGHSFCGVCIETIQKAGQPCPLCKQAEFTTLRNKGLERSLKELLVVCEYKDAGCNWRGELGRLDDHLKVLCPCVAVECQYAECHTVEKRKDISIHESKCGFRPFRCEWCLEYDSRYDDVVRHWTICPMYPVLCAQCSKEVERRNLFCHVDGECPLTTVDCDFSYVGCKARLLRKDHSSHLSAELLSHLAMLNRKLSDDNVHLARRLLELETKMDDQKVKLETRVYNLEETVADMKKQLYAANKKEKALTSYIFKTNTQPQIVPIRFEVRFNKRIQPGAIKTCLFYSHFGGYKMELELYTKELFASPAPVVFNGKYCYNLPDIYIRTRIVEGDFDDCIQWPFNGTIVVCLEPDKRQYISFKDAPLECKSKGVTGNFKWFDPPGMLFLGQTYFTIQNFTVEQVLFNR